MKDISQAWMDYIQLIVDVDIKPEHHRAFVAGTAAEREECALLVEKLGMAGYGSLAIAAAIRLRGNDDEQR